MLIDIRNRKDCEFVRDNLTAQRSFVIGLTSGCFDLFHSLHLAYLQKCRRMCDFLIVGVDGDEAVRRTKGPGLPIVPEHQRVMLVNALECVDVTFVMGSLADWELACGGFYPTVLFKNTDFKPDDVVNPMKSEVVIVPDVVMADSTTAIIQEILKHHERK
jgi:D-beta-D-heptose 7-phosphate kinase/D-beta-D-heptose 1-phosphate adenosyltransferase